MKVVHFWVWCHFQFARTKLHIEHCSFKIDTVQKIIEKQESKRGINVVNEVIRGILMKKK